MSDDNMLKLKAHGNAWIEYDLDPISLKHKIRSLKKKEINKLNSPVCFASYEPLFGIFRRFYAVYSYDNKLYFQVGRTRQDITEGFDECKFWMVFGFASGLLIKFHDGSTHKPVLIHPLRTFFVVIDPTYDMWDMETEHFFLFIRKHVQDAKWRRAIIDRASPKSSKESLFL
jgi:hypothetical protein